MGADRDGARLTPTMGTMLPRALLVLLAVMNLGVALWWVMHPAAPATEAAVALPPGAPELRLLSEAGGTPPPPRPRCHRFGPYSDPAALAAAREAAAALGATAIEVVTLPGPEPDTWRVAAPQPADGDSAALATRIVAAGFDDYRVVAEGAEQGSIALGRFGTRDAAERHARALRDAGFDAQVHPVGGTSDWLHVVLPPAQSAADARLRLDALQGAPVPCGAGR